MISFLECYGNRIYLFTLMEILLRHHKREKCIHLAHDFHPQFRFFNFHFSIRSFAMAVADDVIAGLLSISFRLSGKLQIIIIIIERSASHHYWHYHLCWISLISTSLALLSIWKVYPLNILPSSLLNIFLRSSELVITYYRTHLWIRLRKQFSIVCLPNNIYRHRIQYS